MLSRFDGVGIKAISACIPNTSYSILEYGSDIITEKEVKRFIKSTGFSNLVISRDDVTTSDLCYKAALNFFESNEIDRKDVDGIVFVTQTPDWYLPATCHYLQHKLGLSNKIVCFDINEGCSGYEQGLYIASLLVSSKQCKNVLLLAGDTISKITDPKDRATRLIFGDAGTASIIGEEDSSMLFNINTYGDRYEAIITSGSRHRVTPLSLHNGLLSLDGLGIMNFTLNEVPENMLGLLAFANVKIEEIDLFACHQANKLILMSLADKLEIPREKLPFVAGRTGNTSSASIPLMFCQEKFADLSNVLLCGFGVGLACASCLTDFSNTRIMDVITYESSEV